MQSQEIANSASVPYRRETFVTKQIVLDFDGEFNMSDASSLTSNAKGKGLRQITSDIDSLNHVYDSIGKAYYDDAKRVYYSLPSLAKTDSVKAVKAAMAESMAFDSIYARLSADKKQNAVNDALNKTQSRVSDLEFRSMITSDGDKLIRQHKIEAIKKFTLALSCLIFFFIGAPLGAIIRKGGLGFPVIISVFVFIIFYILDNTGYRMSRLGTWTIWFGQGLAPAVLAPIAIFVTYKASNDSTVFNMEMYKMFFMKLLGLRIKRHVFGKEVIIEEPKYTEDAQRLEKLNSDIYIYNKVHELKKLPNFINVFFKYQPDNEIERISDELENVIEDLTNTRNKVILHNLNLYPILATKAHTRPFERQWLNILAAIIVPVGIVLYLRMWRFRIRLYRDLNTIKQSNANIISQIKEM